MARHLLSLAVVSLLVSAFRAGSKNADRGVRVTSPDIRAGASCPLAPVGTSSTPSGPATGDWETTPNYAVSVTPKGNSSTAPPNSTGNQLNFTVTNTGLCPDYYYYTASGTGPISVTSVSPASANAPVGYHGTVTVTFNVAASGTGQLTLSASGNASDSGYYSITVNAPGVSVTPHGGTAPTRTAFTGGYSQTFTVTNTGNVQTTYSLSCGASSNVTCSRISLTSVTLAAQAAATDTAYYSVSTPGTGTLSLKASGSGVSDSGWYSFTIVAPPVSASPKSGSMSAPANTTNQSTSFTLGGMVTGNNYTLEWYCSGTVNSCTSPQGSSFTATSNSPVSWPINFNTTAPGSGTVQLKLFGNGGQDSGWYNVTVIPPHQVAVTPKGTTTPTLAGGTGGYTAVFTVQNTGYYNDTYSLTCRSTTNVLCTRLSLTTVSIASGATVTDTAYYSVGVAGPGTLTLIAALGTTSTRDSGYYSVPVASYGVAVGPTTWVNVLDNPDCAVDAPGWAGAWGTETIVADNGYEYGCKVTTVNLGGSGHWQRLRNASRVPAAAGQTYTYTLWVFADADATGKSFVPGINWWNSTAYMSNSSGAAVTLARGWQRVSFTAMAPAGTASSQPIFTTTSAQGVFNYWARGAVFSLQATVSGPANSGPHTETFAVTNTGSAPNTYTVTCAGPANCTASPATVPLNPGASVIDTAYYSLQSGPGMLTLTATGTNASDAGSYSVSVGVTQKPSVDIATVNPGATRERSLCLAVAAGAAAAAECGDLRVVHVLPSVRALNKLWTPTLVYNSSEARPYPLVAANVSLPAGAANPDTVYATLLTSGVVRGRAKWAGTDWRVGSASRIVVADTTTADTTGIYTYTLIVTNLWNGAATISDTETVKVPVVNRTKSPFGAGWWLAGIERLYPGSMLWVGGDGSTRQYVAVGTQAMTNCLSGQPSPANNVYTAPNVDRLDTLKFDGGCYTRYVVHGARVQFDQQGRHVATINRLGHVTKFAYAGGDTLISDTLPPSRLIYQFSYVPGQRWVVTAPSVPSQIRADTGTISGGRLLVVRGPDSSRVSFGFGSGQDSNLVTSRTDRRGFATTFSFDAGKKVTQSSLSIGVSAPIIRQWRALETRGYPATGATHAADTAIAYAWYKGPRTDVGDSTLFWLNGFGAPRRIRDALGNTTLLVRGDSRWPGVVTKVVSANGRVVVDSLDGRGNVVLRTDSSTWAGVYYAQSRFSWDSTWDFVTKIVPPMYDSTVVAYAAANGNRLWQQDARGSLSRVTFGYDSFGLLQSITVPSVFGAQYFYHDHLGNDSAQVTPKGFTTVLLRDGIGRDTLRLTPVDSLQAVKDTQLIVYDAMGRDTFSISIGPVTSYQFHYSVGTGGLLDKTYSTPEESLYVRKVYDPNGNLTQLWRKAGPDVNAIGWSENQFQYDAANRKVVEIPLDTVVKADSTFYDPAGNIVRVRNRESRNVTMAYDALNRLVQRIKGAAWDSLWPSIHYSSGNYGHTLPRYYVTNGPQGWGVTVPGDTAKFAYDAVGHLITADNRDARIRRHHNLNGSLASDTLIIMPWTGSDTTLHVYGLQFGYDLDGRRIWLKHPDAVAPRVNGTVKDSVAYTYTVNGQLASVTDVLGNQFRWAYDPAGRLDTLYYPGLIWEHWTYDSDSRVTERIEHDSLYVATDSGFGAHVFRDDTYLYDARGKVVQAIETLNGSQNGIFDGYTGLGTLARSGILSPLAGGAASEEGFHPDALGRNERTWTASVPPLPVQSDSAHNVQMQHYYPFTGALGEARNCGQTVCNIGSVDTVGAVNLVDSTGDRTRQRTYGQGMTAGGVLGQEVISLQNYADGGGQIRFADRQSCDVYYQSSSSYGCYAPAQIPWLDRGSFEDYRYDALSRRVLVRSRADTTCQYQRLCQSTIQRTVWEGEHVLYELRYPGADTVSSSALEQDTVLVSADSAPYGRVAYIHGPGIDQPLGAIRIGYNTIWPMPVAAILHADWRGVIDLASFDNGAANRCLKKAAGTDSSLTTCISPDPAAGRGNAYFHDPYQPVHAPLAWFGSTVALKRDASGQLYMRNRYYDPNSGQFTQEDPIGLAGGLNLFGFAQGDPINYSDPFGLCPKIKDKNGNETKAPCILFAILAGEARSATREFQTGAANVIKNRAKLISGDYNAVINARGQFSAMRTDDPNRTVVDKVLATGEVDSGLRDVVEGVYNGTIGDNTQGALLYYSPQSMNPAYKVPGWNFGQLTLTAYSSTFNRRLDATVVGGEGMFFRCVEGTSCWARP